MRSENANRAKTAARRAVAGDGVVKDDDGEGCVLGLKRWLLV